ncbi:hypothetical protein TW85_08595 [Marinomonas sp. S3726]|uniref:hypothetical protein n=1 Tax=Marinomonas sp. S3726 TaxID=579484 RepID=UPI0005FA0AB6|nr:hypothetical protein [Marinomonas sp. S3726]KJZ14769.1 hypothetical protein TW85_08595 [Marinomonas sp. S3726]
MIFIQALEKMHAKANDKVKIRARSNQHATKPDADSVFLSDAANHAVEVNLTSEAYTKLDANMSIEASLLQAAIQHLNKTLVPIYSLDELDLGHNKWHLALQQPPNTVPRHKNHYGLGVKPCPTDILNYKFVMPVTSTAGRQFKFYLELRVARFTQAANHWPLPEIEPIQLEVIPSPYNGRFLESVNTDNHYFLDQDGDENQTLPILNNMRDKTKFKNLPENHFFSGLRVWRCNNDLIKIILLGEAGLGAVYIANIKT